MKNTKNINFFTVGVLPVLLLAGCFNPISMERQKIGGGGNGLGADPFTIDIMIGKDGETRSVTGPDVARIKGDGRNIIQLIVVDKVTGNITAFDEVRRESNSLDPAIFTIDSIPIGKTYSFLLLMGHWERDYAREVANNNGKYVYLEANPPTLMAAGFKEQLITNNGKVSITMWPIVVDTIFKTVDTGVPGILRMREAVMNAGKPENVTLLPVEWTVNWMVKRGTSGDGLDVLVRAQKAIDCQAGDELLVKSKGSIVRGTGLNDLTTKEPTVKGNIVTLPIGSDYTKGIRRIGAEGSVNFKLEYIPYNLKDGSKWMAYNGKSAFDLDGKAPVWIIRNGVNDQAQDQDTDFNNFGKTDTGKANGNGAISYKVAAVGAGDKEFPGYLDLTLTKGQFKRLSNSNTAKITFTTGGYDGTGEAYYAITGQNDPEPLYSAYTESFGGLAAGTHEKEVKLPTAEGNYFVYVVLFKNGNVSKRIRYDTVIGALEVDFNWGGSS
ncbi:MAG: hypothetical protein LBB98_14720 [Treponema sp.]|nr:hypothetical protein [Treponema sp.]